MSRISELFSRQLTEYTDDGDCIYRHHTEEELNEIIAYLREHRHQFNLGKAAMAKAEEREAKAAAQAAEREAKAAGKAAAKAAKALERAARKRDPRQFDLEETIAASAGDAEKDVPQR